MTSVPEAVATKNGSDLDRFLNRLLLRSELNGQEQDAVRSLRGEKEVFRSNVDIVRMHETVSHSCLVIRGLIARYDDTRDGNRQITSFYIPGDVCDLHSVVAPKASWAITSISSSKVLFIAHADLKAIVDVYPNLALAFWRDTTVDASIFSKWVGNLGRMNAIARAAHIFCEMGTRLEAAGLAQRAAYDLQITQDQLGEAAGVTPIHMNRTLQKLRSANLITFGSGRVEILDWDRLAAIAEFDPTYLMLEKRKLR